MTPATITLNNQLNISRIVHGYWRLQDWNLSTTQIESLIYDSIALGITTLDHADIYGDYQCEALFGKALNHNSRLREQIQLVSKCGIKLISDKFPDRSVKYYDYSYDYIVSSAENSLKNLRTEYLDVLLLHRPSPLYNPEEVAKAFAHLKASGKVRHFGVSNFTPQQSATLSSYLDSPLITNQVEISVACLEHFDNGNIDYFLQQRMHPMAWSPLAGGGLFNPKTAKDTALVQTIKQVAKQQEVQDLSAIMYAWLLMHPVGIIPIVGSGKLNRLETAVKALDITLTSQQWFSILQASRGQEVA